jgi:hypothetical protein
MSIKVWCGRSCLFKGFSDPWDLQILSPWEADATVHWSIPYSQKDRHRGLQAKATRAMSDVYDVFHISQLRKCLRVPEEQVVSNTLDLQDDMRYQEVPIKIFDTMAKRTRMKHINLCKVQWSRH